MRNQLLLLIYLILLLLRYETAWSLAQLSPWCNLFSAASLEALDYKEDLIYYYHRAYPFQLTMDSTQPIWKDLINTLEKVRRNEPLVNSTGLLFGHGLSVSAFMAALNLYRDPEFLTAEDFPARDRLWKLSEIGCFSANLAVIVADCDSSGIDNSTADAFTTDASTTNAFTTDSSTTNASTTDTSTADAQLEEKQNDEASEQSYKPRRHKIFMFLQEKLIPFPSGVEYLDEFIDEYGYRAHVNFEQICRL